MIVATWFARAAGAAVVLPALLPLAEIERLSPNDRVGYFHELRAITASLDAAQSARLRGGWAEAPRAKSSACFAAGVVTRTEPYVRPPECRQVEKTFDDMRRRRPCWTARRSCPGPLAITWGAETFRCPTPARRPCNPFLYGLPKRGAACVKLEPGAPGLCRVVAHADGIARAIRARGLAKEFDEFAATGFAALCEGDERHRVLGDRACARFADQLRRFTGKYRAKLKLR